VNGVRFQGRTIGSVKLSTSSVSDPFGLSKACCNSCNERFPDAQAFFVCVNRTGCREVRPDTAPWDCVP
jgi:hypothetical protein